MCPKLCKDSISNTFMHLVSLFSEWKGRERGYKCQRSRLPSVGSLPRVRTESSIFRDVTNCRSCRKLSGIAEWKQNFVQITTRGARRTPDTIDEGSGKAPAWGFCPEIGNGSKTFKICLESRNSLPKLQFCTESRLTAVEQGSIAWFLDTIKENGVDQGWEHPHLCSSFGMPSWH